MAEIAICIEEHGKKRMELVEAVVNNQGLAIHKCLRGKEWTITHVSTGLTVTYPGSRDNMRKIHKALIAAAEEYGHSWEEKNPLKWPKELLEKVQGIRTSYHKYSSR